MSLNKLLITSLALALSFSFAGCDDDDKPATTAGTAAGTAAGTDAGATAGTSAGTSAGTDAGTSAGTDAGASAGVDVPPPMGDCDVSCGAFAECAANNCSGYTATDAEVLKAGCLRTCTPALAGVFDGLATCAEKIMFVSGVQPSFAASCNSTTGRFCETYTEVCGEWTAETACADWYLAAPAGDAGATEGANQACYQYHLSVASMMDAEVHCAHARGESVCADAPAPTAAETFCAQYQTTCGDWTAMTPCVDWFNAAPVGDAGATEGANQACYAYHLGAAASDAALHCPHARGESVCVDAPAPTAAETFCAQYQATCGDWTAMTPCVDWFNAAPAGDAGATEGANQACYTYHLGAAASDAALHCPHARGEDVCVTP